LSGLAKIDRSPPRVFATDHPLSAKFRGLCSNPKPNTFSVRLQLLEIFTEVVGNGLKTSHEEIIHASTPITSARVRIVELLKEMPAAALLNLTLNEVVTEIRCTPRHVSRVFNEVVGMSFRKKQNEVRLQRAQELLATTEGKVLEVAMESGFQSVTLFNLMFKRRFGITPGRWREKAKENDTTRRPRTSRLM
jgi:AraC-like DNA-binding protein